MSGAVIGAPEGVAADLEATRGLKVPGAGKVALDWLLVFESDQAAVKRFGPPATKAVKPEGYLWFAYPKLAGTIRTDVNRDTGWEPLRALGSTGRLRFDREPGRQST